MLLAKPWEGILSPPVNLGEGSESCLLSFPTTFLLSTLSGGYSLPVLGKLLEAQEHREIRREKVLKTKMVKSDLQVSGFLRETRAHLSSI